MAQKVRCAIRDCKYHEGEDKCTTTVRIGSDLRCASFEKGFVYYFHAVWDAMNGSNMIPMHELNEDVKIGLFYVMSVFHVGYSTNVYGNWQFLTLQDGEGGPALSAEDIVSREMDDKRFAELLEEFNAGKLPGRPPADTDPAERREKADLGFGWLSPAGDFTPSPWGDHEESAEVIINERHIENEYRAWRKSGDIDMILCRDFLTHEKGYCLIHNPSNDGAYIVTHIKPLTKRQREFLYEYFTDKGDRFRAEMYFNGEE